MRLPHNRTVRLVLLYALIVVYFGTILIIDRLYWPGNNLPILFAVAIVTSALEETPGFVGLVAATAVFLDLIESLSEGASTNPWPFTAIALVGVGIHAARNWVVLGMVAIGPFVVLGRAVTFLLRILIFFNVRAVRDT